MTTPATSAWYIYMTPAGQEGASLLSSNALPTPASALTTSFAQVYGLYRQCSAIAQPNVISAELIYLALLFPPGLHPPKPIGIHVDPARSSAAAGAIVGGSGSGGGPGRSAVAGENRIVLDSGRTVQTGKWNTAPLSSIHRFGLMCLRVGASIVT